ncbi:MAG TPA: DNA primase [Candidatus Sumerlaeota bacterium]|nr:DNA primase [Candidatus Sumerlaeota bacterium]
MSEVSSNYREFADRVRTTADIVEVVGQYVELRRAGANLKACCPFHQEKTPSFHVHAAKQIFKCFGCGKSGDVIGFVREIERVDFTEALRILAEKYHLEVPKFRAITSAEEEQLRWRQTLGEILETASRYYESLLAHPERGAEIREYLRGRGLSEPIIQAFHLGASSPGWEDLAAHLRGKGYSERGLVEVSLVRERDGGGSYDYLRDRLIFPIQNARGATIAFGGRVLPGREGPKYLNTSETVLFHKGRELYGLYQAREALTRAGQPAVLVEGYMDVIACHQAGVTSAVASMGTSLTPEQAKLIRRYTPRTVFLYDADEAGIKAILRGLEVLLSANLTVSVGLMPAGEDPDSYARQNGAEALRQVVETAIPFFDFLLVQARKRYNLDAPEESVHALELFQPVLEAIQEPMVHDGYIRKLAVALGHEETTLRRYLAQHVRRAPGAASHPEPKPQTKAPVTEDGPPELAPPADLDDFDHPDLDAFPVPTAEPQTSVPLGATEPTQREKGLLRILIEHNDARVLARQQLNPHWIENALVRYWTERLLEAHEHVSDTWPLLTQLCQGSPQHEAFLQTVIFSTEGQVGPDYLAVMEHLMALIEADYYLAENKRLNRKIAQLSAEGNKQAILELCERQQQNLRQRQARRTQATKESPALRIQH